MIKFDLNSLKTSHIEKIQNQKISSWPISRARLSPPNLEQKALEVKFILEFLETFEKAVFAAFSGYSVFPLFIQTDSKLTSAGVTPEIRLACPRVLGWMRISFCRPSKLRLGMVL